MKSLKIPLLLFFFIAHVYAQKIDVEYKTMVADPRPETKRILDISDMELSPDQKTLAIGRGQGPVLMWDVPGEKFIKAIEVDGYFAGPRIKYGQNGKYLLLQKMYYTDNNLNKDRSTKIDVLDIESGKVIFNKPDVHDAALTFDCKYVLTLSGNNVDIYELSSRNLVRTIVVEDATNALAVSNDGKTVAVSHKLRAGDIQDIPSIRDDKKTIKAVLKYRQGISFYDFESGKRMKTASDIFDIVFNMRYTQDGKRILVYNAANTKFQAEAGGKHTVAKNNDAGSSGGEGGRQGYISQIDATTGEVLRTIVSSMIAEPDYKESNGNKYLGVSSIEKTPLILIYDMETGDLLNRFEVTIRLFKDVAASPPAFVFLPDNKTVWLNHGGKIAIWKLPTN